MASRVHVQSMTSRRFSRSMQVVLGLVLVLCTSFIAPVRASADNITITFVMNGHGSQVGSASCPQGDSCIGLPTPVEKGFVFDRWYLDSELSIVVSSQWEEGGGFDANTTLYAKWEPGVTASWVLGGHGTIVNDFTTVKPGSTLSAPKVTATTATLVGWYTDVALTVAYSLPRAITEDVTLYAKWAYTLTFELGGHGSPLASQQVAIGGTASEPNAPTASGWTFGGWFSDAARTQAFSFSTPLTSSATAYAKWIQDAVTPSVTPSPTNTTPPTNNPDPTPTSTVDPKDDQTPPASQPDVPVVLSVKAANGAVQLVKGKSITIPVIAYTNTGTTSKVTWKSSSPKIATVSTTGKIKAAKRAGTAIITATAENGKKATIKVTVVKKTVKVKSVKATGIPKTLVVGKTASAKGSFSPAKATGVTVAYKSSASKVASVDKAGTITAKAKGKTVITVKAGNKSKKYSLSVK